jgi:hypothetical protein
MCPDVRALHSIHLESTASTLLPQQLIGSEPNVSDAPGLHAVAKVLHVSVCANLLDIRDFFVPDLCACG